MPISHQIASIIHLSCEKCTPRDFIQLFSRLFLGVRKVAYALLTHPPLVSIRRPVTVRLACIKPAASVHPEPGSNSH